jgi:hypothetical protein
MHSVAIFFQTKNESLGQRNGYPRVLPPPVCGVTELRNRDLRMVNEKQRKVLERKKTDKFDTQNAYKLIKLQYYLLFH